ncbi:MAG: hypothetical protein AB9866_18605 [Syntrophobacteraceae bacterium]
MFSTPEKEGQGRGHDECCIGGAGELPQETKDALVMAAEVLESKTKYARLLMENIKSLHEPIQFTSKIEKMEWSMLNLTERLAALEIAERERLQK